MNDERCLQLSQEKKENKVRGTGGNDGGNSHRRVSPLVRQVIGGFGMYYHVSGISTEAHVWDWDSGFGIRDYKRSM